MTTNQKASWGAVFIMVVVIPLIVLIIVAATKFKPLFIAIGILAVIAVLYLTFSIIRDMILLNIEWNKKHKTK